MRKNGELESLIEREEKSELLFWSEQVVHDMRISTGDLHISVRRTVDVNQYLGYLVLKLLDFKE